jgi:hypothetical protein
MILPGTYANGFAPRDGEPLFPELWRGCVGAWNPGLGPSGLTLRDWSPYKNHGTLTNMDAGTDWVASQGRYVLDFDRTDDYVGMGGTPVSGRNVIVSFWVRVLAINNSYFPRILCIADGTHSLQFVLDDGGSGNEQLNTKSSEYQSGTSATRWGYRPVASTWEHVLAFFNPGVSTTRLWRNGVEQAGASANNVGAVATTGTFVGVRSDLNAVTFFGGQVDDIRIYHSNDTAMAKLLASRRGIAYELAPRKRTYSIPAAPGGFQPYWATQRSQMIGGGVR